VNPGILRLEVEGEGGRGKEEYGGGRGRDMKRG